MTFTMACATSLPTCFSVDFPDRLKSAVNFRATGPRSHQRSKTVTSPAEAQETLHQRPTDCGGARRQLCYKRGLPQQIRFAPGVGWGSMAGLTAVRNEAHRRR